MPPAGKKDCSVILFDLATKEREAAIQTLLKISCYNYFSGSKDLAKLVLLNSSTTENRLSERDNRYKHIQEIGEDVSKYEPERFLENIYENSETAEADWLGGLYVALKILEQDCEHISGIVTHQVLLITDLSTDLPKYEEAFVDKVVAELKTLNVFLYVVGPDVSVPFTIKNEKCVKLWMENLTINENNQNLKILKKIITSTPNSVVCDYKLGTHLFFSYRNWGGSQPWLVPLAVGSKIEIPAQTIKILNDMIPCKLRSAQGAIRDAMWIDAEDESVEVDLTNVISGIMRHEKFVPVPDNKMFQVQNSRSFSLLCFTDSVNVPEYLMRDGGCYCVLPNSTPEKNEALYILIDCLAKQDKYVIAQRIYNANGIPKIVVLVPKPDHNPKCFYLASLPYGEDIRLHYKERKLESAPTSDTNDEVYNFLSSINVDDDSSEKRLTLGINMMQSYSAFSVVNAGADKLFGKGMKLGEMDINLLEAPSGKVFEALRNSWPERTIEKVKKSETEDNNESDNDFDW